MNKDTQDKIREVLNYIYIEGRSRKSFEKGKEVKYQALTALTKIIEEEKIKGEGR